MRSLFVIVLFAPLCALAQSLNVNETHNDYVEFKRIVQFIAGYESREQNDSKFKVSVAPYASSSPALCNLRLSDLNPSS